MVEEKSTPAEVNESSALHRDWTRGSIARNLLSLSWPMIVSDGINTVGPLVDMLWVAKLGAASVAGVGIAGLTLMIVQFGADGLNAGMRAMVARFVGAGDYKSANHVAQQNLVVLSLYALVMTVIGIMFAEPMLKFFGVAPDVVREGSAYLRISFLSASAVAFHQMTEIIMGSAGDAVTPMKISIVMRILHAVTCPFLVFGWWFFPRLGVSGAAIANLASLALAVSLGLWVIFTGRSRLRLSLKNYHFDFNIIWRIVRIGIPNSIMSAQWGLGGILLIAFVVPYGTVAVAAHTLVGNIMGYVAVPSFGLARAAGVLVGQNLGAKQPQRAQRSAWLAVVLAEAFIIIVAVVVLLWPENLIRIFSPDPEVIRTTSLFMRIALASILAWVFSMIFEQSLSGAGDTLPPMLISLIRLWVITLPLAWFLPHLGNLGVLGIRWAIVAGEVVDATAFIIYFQLGRWKLKKV